MVAGLNSNPEILLRKRRNADRIRLEKQELAQRRQELKKKQARARKNKFERAESIVATSLATQREKERIKRVSKLEAKRAKGDDKHLASDRDFILKVLEDGSAATADADAGADADSLHTEKCIYDGKPTLLFVVRIRGPTAAKIPQKAHKVLSLLRLTELNTGVFLRLTAQVYPLLKLVAPYVVVGEPSLASVRSLIQKRSRVLVNSDDQEEPKESILNDNNLVEEKLGSEGIICVEDIIHEIATLGESFAKCNFFLLPFRLNREVSGFSALSKLQKIRQREWQKRTLKVSNAATAPVVQVDIDSLIAKLN